MLAEGGGWGMGGWYGDETTLLITIEWGYFSTTNSLQIQFASQVYGNVK